MSTYVQDLLKRELEHLTLCIKNNEETLKDLRKKYSQTRDALAKLDPSTPASVALGGTLSGHGSASASVSARDLTLRDILTELIGLEVNGLTSAELDERVRQIRPETGGNSVFSTLSRLKGEGTIDKGVDGRWRSASIHPAPGVDDDRLAETSSSRESNSGMDLF